MKKRTGNPLRSKLQRILASTLAVCMVATSIPMAFAAAGDGNIQVESPKETIYVNSYSGSERSENFNDHWRFYLGDADGAENTVFNDSEWTEVTLPHDYSADQGFTHSAPAEQESGYALGGTGWYRKSFILSDDMKGKAISLDFDGVYMNATIWVNGQELGEHHYGYTPFSFVLPNEILKFSGEENIVAVKVDHQLPSSRWYSGSGIYRNVYMTVTDPVHVAYHGNYVTTPTIAEEAASGAGTVHIETDIQNDKAEAAQVSVQHTVYRYNEDNSALEQEAVVTGEPTAAQEVAVNATATLEGDISVPEPALWSPDDPNLYRVRTDVLVDGKVVDSVEADFGFRWFKFTNEGFWLNGEKMRMHGVCLHHDQGSLGSEAWYASMARQIDLMKEMGVNAYRTSHNPVSDEMIDICNKKGMLVLEEAFDGWRANKDSNNHDMGEWFDEKVGAENQIVYGEPDMTWAQFDLEAMIRRDRNAPSVFSWSIGNEIKQLTSGASTDDYGDRAVQLLDWGSKIDNSRVFAYGCNNTNGSTVDVARALYNHKDDSGNRGLAGYNYGNGFTSGHNWDWNVYAAETASAVNSRGVYDRKATRQDLNGDKLLTSYDKSAVSWGQTASDAMWEMTWANYLFGEFVWTGIDYIGEPTPWNWTGPGANGQSKNSYFGVVDTAGFPKDTYYLYRSQWNDSKKTLHLLPTWDENDVMKDDQGRVEVVVYSNAPYIELELNGEVIGAATATFNKMEENDVYVTYDAGTGVFSKGSNASSQYATFWVPYQAGTLEVKGYDSPEKTTQITDFEGRSKVSTTKGGSKLNAYADRESIDADGKDLSFVTIDVTDADGSFVNSAEPEITVSVEGDGRLMSMDNGVHADWTNYSSPTRAAGRGKLLAIVQSTKQDGSFTVTASSRGLQSSSVTVNTTPVSSGEPVEGSISRYEMSRNLYVKVGNMPKLPETAAVHYADGTTTEKAITWEAIPEENIQKDGTFSVSGKLEGMTVSVNVTMISEAAALLNYSAAVTLGSDPNLPTARPAVLADGTILNAQFPVAWNTDGVDFQTEGLKVVSGTANVLGKQVDVTATVRVAAGEDILTDNMAPLAPKSFINGEPSDGALNAVIDGKTTADSAGWTGTGSIYFEYVTAANFKQAKLYLKDTAPTSDTMRLYRSGDEGATWQLIESGLKVSNERADGVTIRTYDFDVIPGTAFKLEFDKEVTLLEAELMNSTPDFPVGSEAALSSLQVGGYIAGDTDLTANIFTVPDKELSADDVTVEGKDNASATILPKDADNVIRILLESEDHAERSVYQVQLGKDSSGSDDPNDASRDYAYQDMKVTAPSVESGGSAANANDGKSDTIWHSNWGGGTGSSDLTNDPDNRYIQIEIPAVTKLNGFRYLPRSTDQNGIVTKYSIKLSTDGTTWTEAATGTWDTSVVWKLAQFAPTDAKHIRLYGVETATNEGKPQKYMSAAEIRVRCAATELYGGNTSVTLVKDSYDYTGQQITPEPTVVYNDGTTDVTLEADVDYTVSYRNNTQPGTAAVRVTGKGNYAGIVEKAFTIHPVDEEIEGYEDVEVTTGVGEYPILPGTVIANTNLGQKLVEVEWDVVNSGLLEELGSFKVYGTVSGASSRIAAVVKVSGVVGAENVSTITAVGAAPSLPDTVAVYYSNGDTAQREVAWALDGVRFDGEAGSIVAVAGMVGSTQVTANVRLVTDEALDANTVIKSNLALNPDAYGQTQATDKWPVIRAYGSTKGAYVTNLIDGKHAADGGKVWTSATSGARADFYAVTVGFGEGSKTGKLQTVSKAVLDFAAPDGSALPEGYKVQYYSGNGGMFDASRFFGTGDIEHVGNTQNWSNTNPVNIDDNWTDVELTSDAYPVPAEDHSAVEVAFAPVKTSAIRVVFTPASGKQVSLYELEFSYVPEVMNSSIADVSIKAGETELSFGAEKTAVVDLGSETKLPEITAEAGNNAAVTVVKAVNANSAAKVIITPEDGDTAKQEIYTIQFQSEGDSAGEYYVSSRNPNVTVEPARTDKGTVVTIAPKSGYAIQDGTVKVLKSADLTEAGVGVTAGEGEKAGTYTFLMPEFDVTVDCETVEDTEHTLTVTYSNNVTLKVDGEDQKLADLIGSYQQKDVPAEEQMELSFAPVHEGREFAAVSVVVNGKEFPITAEEGSVLTEANYTLEMPNKDTEVQFVGAVVDKSLLRLMIEKAKEAKEGDEYANAVPAVQKKFDKAYEAAVAVEKNPDALQDTINGAWSDLIDAMAYLSFQSGDKEGLTKLIEVLADLEEENFTPKSWAVYAEALADAGALLADENALENDLQAAEKNLLDAAKALVLRADVSELNALIAQGEEIAPKLDDYMSSEAVKKAFTDALDKAKELAEDANAEQKAVNDAANALTEAIAALRLTPDKDALNALVEKAKNADPADYTTANYAALQASIRTAKAVLAKEDASQEEITSAYRTVEERLAAKEDDKEEETPTNKPNGNQGSGSSGSSGPKGNAYGSSGKAVASGVLTAAQTVAEKVAVRSDTTADFTLKKGGVYCFKMTVFNSNTAVPSFTVGNGSVLKTQFVGRSGNDYYYRVYAVGAPGQSAGVYTTMSGQETQRHCVVTIA